VGLYSLAGPELDYHRSPEFVVNFGAGVRHSVIHDYLDSPVARQKNGIAPGGDPLRCLGITG
jgi:hypothetical protein